MSTLITIVLSYLFPFNRFSLLIGVDSPGEQCLKVSSNKKIPNKGIKVRFKSSKIIAGRVKTEPLANIVQHHI